MVVYGGVRVLVVVVCRVGARRVATAAAVRVRVRMLVGMVIAGLLRVGRTRRVAAAIVQLLAEDFAVASSAPCVSRWVDGSPEACGGSRERSTDVGRAGAILGGREVGRAGNTIPSTTRLLHFEQPDLVNRHLEQPNATTLFSWAKEELSSPAEFSTVSGTATGTCEK